jgi:hypothetical protein
MIMLLLIGLGSAGDGSQASPASADYQAGFARGLELGMEIATLLSAAPFNSNALELFNQRAAEFNGEVDLVFGNGSDLSKQYRLQPFGEHANDTVALNGTDINRTAINQTAINQTADNQASKNSAAVEGKFSGKYYIIFENETEKAGGSSIPKLTGNATVEKEHSADEDLGDILKDWSGNAEVPPDFLTGMPGPESV